MKSLIIPDIHNKIEGVDALLNRERPDEVIYIGDAFDSVGDTPEDALRTARWLKARLHLPGHHFILGNHELQYRWPKAPWHVTAAYSKDKQEAIDSVLSPTDWKKTNFAVQRGNWWFTHAGLHPNLFVHPILGWDDTRVWNILHEAEFKAHAGIYTPITDEARAYGDTPSGPQWLRWSEFEPIPRINQVVGHTAHLTPPEIHLSGCSQNVNLDTWMQFYAILEDNRLKVLPNPEAPKLIPEIREELTRRTLKWENSKK